MKNQRYIVAIILIFLGGLSVSYANTNPSRMIYTPSALEDTYQVNLRDISRTAPFADQILVMDELSFTPVNVLEALQGRVAGVRVHQRGWNWLVSIRGWQRPLYVIDGIPVDAWAVNMLSPNDVATVEVHKGFGASLFGMRGTGGAIVVNTK